MNRRHFLKVAGLGLLGVAVAPFIKLPEDSEATPKEAVKKIEAPEPPTAVYPTLHYYDGTDYGNYWVQIPVTSSTATNSSITVSNVW